MSGGVTSVAAPSSKQALAIEEKLAASAAAHQAAVDRRRLASSLANDPSENVDAFLQSFEVEITAVSRGSSTGASLVGRADEAARHFDELSQRCAALNEKLSAAAMFLPAYQLRQRQQALASLLTELEASRAKAVPKKRFAFSKKRAKKPLAAVASEHEFSAAESGQQLKLKPEPEPEPEPETEPETHVDANEQNDRFDPAYLVTQKV
eukprot:COSAG01_NODE_16667_length_1216_cov_24.754700_1_plen_207_part_10